MKKNYLFIICALLLAACHSKEVGFVYSPTQPRAGQTISFTNTSEEGDVWSWNFGDGTSSAVKNPTKIYEKPGSYLVSLKVDDKSKMTYSTTIVVADTIPTIVTVDSANVCEEVKFLVNFYNPQNLQVTYLWEIGSNGDWLYSHPIDSAVTVLFNKANDAETIKCQITIGQETYSLEKTLKIKDIKAPSLLVVEQNKTLGRRRVLGNYLSVKQVIKSEADVVDICSVDSVSYLFEKNMISTIKNSEVTELLRTESAAKAGAVSKDSIYWLAENGELNSAARGDINNVYKRNVAADINGLAIYNNVLCLYGAGIRIGQKHIFPHIKQIEHLSVDAVSGKFYLISAGKLFVANIDGAENSVVQLAETDGHTLAIDYINDRLYFTEQGQLKAFPLIHSKNNYSNIEAIDLGGSDFMAIYFDNQLRNE